MQYPLEISAKSAERRKSTHRDLRFLKGSSRRQVYACADGWSMRDLGSSHPEWVD